ncbi:translation initiation factor 2 [Pseudomonas sp. 148P]|uniref:Translation initiation factor 2 n=1 Tax=Pseudomonas ulcerans TaxID=3115852 RepID=A0ABU7HP79_9PSED|nr:MULTISPECIES: translation initiation factor 2 [unclassified Pseudomonas]MEE1920558.1 translation initiation factor 2 [Pseudomonas sp. 147P]MEE1933340.1 translation initiation factor 2 [Pseudomonas sp. 148P]
MTPLRCASLLLAGLLAVPLAGQALADPAAAPLLLAEAKAPVQKAEAGKAKPQPAKKTAVTQKTVKKPVKASKTTSRKKADAIAAPLPKAKLDLSLPPDMVKGMKPVEQIEAEVRKPLLPAMFGEKPEVQSPFQLNGRLLSNEMQLQLRNESRQQEIEGAAIEFEFKQ